MIAKLANMPEDKQQDNPELEKQNKNKRNISQNPRAPHPVRSKDSLSDKVGAGGEYFVTYAEGCHTYHLHGTKINR